MEIIVLDYHKAEVDIIDYTNKNPDEIEDYLCSLGYNLDDIHYMTAPVKIEINYL